MYIWQQQFNYLMIIMRIYIMRVLVVLITLFITQRATAQVVGTPYIPMVDIPFSFLYGGDGTNSFFSKIVCNGDFYYGATTSNSSSSGDITEMSAGGDNYWIVKWDRFGKIVWQKLIGGNGLDVMYEIASTADGGCIVVGYTDSAAFSGTIPKGGTDALAVKLDAIGNTQWIYMFGGSENDEFHSVSQTSDGGYIIAGVTNSTNGDLTGVTHYGGGTLGSDGWLLKLNTDGSIVWQKEYGGNNGDDNLEDVIQTSDGGYIFSGTTSSTNVNTLAAAIDYYDDHDVFITKVTNDGTIQWVRRVGVVAGNEYPTGDLKQTAEGGYILGIKTNASSSGSLVDISGFGGTDCWILKLNTDGSTAWQKLYGGSANEGLSGIGIIQTSDGGYMCAFSTDSSNTGTLTGLVNHGGYDILIQKIDSAGAVIWQKLYGGSDDEPNTVSIAQTTEKEYVVLSLSRTAPTSANIGNGDVYDLNHGQQDLWLFKINAQGNILWTPDMGQR